MMVVVSWPRTPGGLHEVAGVERRQLLGLARREPEAGQAGPSTVVHVVLEVVHGLPTGGDGGRGGGAGGEQHEAVEDVVVEAGGRSQRGVAPLDGSGEAQAEAGVDGGMALEVAEG